MIKGGWNEEGGQRLEEEKMLLVNMFGDKRRQGKRMEEEKKGAVDEVEKLFESKELDVDGRLSFEEFMGEQSRAEKLFKLMDKDGDGFVTKNVIFFISCLNLILV